jgi:drug/metabolite transporter (DMT)-like permease
VIPVVLAVLAAACNALASVLQRQAVRSVPASVRLTLVVTLVRRRVWLGGIAALIGGFLFQAAALRYGELSLVQPILVTELPFTMFLIAGLFQIRLGRESWLAVGSLTAGLAALLTAAAPAQGRWSPGWADWTTALVLTIGLIGCLVATAKSTGGVCRAAVLGVASGLGFSFTAALMKETTPVLQQGARALATSWSLYAMVGTGLVSLLLLQIALHSGTLVAVQPALTVSDPVASIAYGVGLFGEQIRLGSWAVLELAGVGLILYGSVRLAQSPLIRRHAEVTTPDL